jgi:hypothetical protein
VTFGTNGHRKARGAGANAPVINPIGGEALSNGQGGMNSDARIFSRMAAALNVCASSRSRRPRNNPRKISTIFLEEPFRGASASRPRVRSSIRAIGLAAAVSAQPFLCLTH